MVAIAQESEVTSEKPLPGKADIETALNQGIALKQWWDSGVRVDTFPLIAERQGAKETRGFFAEPELLGKKEQVMGVVQDTFFDRPKFNTKKKGEQQRYAEWMQGQMEAFGLKYLMRSGSWSPNQFYPAINPMRVKPPEYLKALAMLPPMGPKDSGGWEVEGLGERQLYYLARDGQNMERFSKEQETAVVFLEELKETYDWVGLESSLFSGSIDITLGEPGEMRPKVLLRLGQRANFVMSKELCAYGEKDGDDLGTYGPGAALLKMPGDGFFAYAPDKVQPGIILRYFQVLRDSQIRCRTLSIFNRPEKILNVAMNPLPWAMMMTNCLGQGVEELTKPLRSFLEKLPKGPGFDPIFGTIDLANLLTQNRAAEQFCFSKQMIEKIILTQHALAMESMVVGTRLIWDMVPDWTDTKAIPQWVITGDPTQG